MISDSKRYTEGDIGDAWSSPWRGRNSSSS